MKEINRNDAYSLARNIAKRIVSGEISEHEGATKIWKEVLDKLSFKCPDDLWPFKSNSSAIEDIKWNSEHDSGNKNEKLIYDCEQEIMAAAKKLTNHA